ncbi:spore coat protein CotJB [Eubacteriales bacterium OttesenSCG-928-K08]|nr:spore coat protein CotJB [Eubacteriales bacterium OttesenSCG-928-K08]
MKDCTQNNLLRKISEVEFVCVELNLYLDTHPTDKNARNDYLCYSKKLQSLIKEYEACFGPLTNFGHSPTEAGCWVCSKWPWQL